ncbi:MAG: recombination protein RecO [Sulfurovaceae bacterium]
MKGFVLNLKKAKNEDMIALIISANEIKHYYRFFGARHSILQIGHLIDYEIEGEGSSYMIRLRGLSHIGFPWLHDKNRLLIWHNFISLFAPHLRDTGDIDPFYYNLLLDAAKRWDKQNPKRIICESYIKLLKFEGRLYQPQTCYICEQHLALDISLMHAFLPAHPECIYSASICRDKLLSLYDNESTLYLENEDVEYLFGIIMKGF